MNRLTNRIFYGWIVVVCLFIISTVLFGIQYSFGFFFSSIETEFNISRTVTSTITSLNLVLGGLAAFAGGWALDRYGPRKVVLIMGLCAGFSLLLTSQTQQLWQLFITFSLLLSLGTGAVYAVPTSAVARWFNKKRGLALGIYGSGSGLGPLVMAPVATYLILNFDWRTAFIVIGAAALVIIVPLSQLLKRDPSTVGALVDGRKSDSVNNPEDAHTSTTTPTPLREVFVSPTFWIIAFSWLVFGCGLFLMFTHLVINITGKGFLSGEASTVIVVVGGAAILGRVAMGISSDRIGRKITVFIACILQFGAMLWLVWAKELWMFYLFAAVYGFGYSGFASSIGAYIGDIFPVVRIGTIIGAVEICFGIGAALGPILGGVIFDATGSYTLAFLTMAITLFLSAVLLLLTKSQRQKTLA